MQIDKVIKQEDQENKDKEEDKNWLENKDFQNR